jgi:hypothetical protein
MSLRIKRSLFESPSPSPLHAPAPDDDGDIKPNLDVDTKPNVVSSSSAPTQTLAVFPDKGATKTPSPKKSRSPSKTQSAKSSISPSTTSIDGLTADIAQLFSQAGWTDDKREMVCSRDVCAGSQVLQGGSAGQEGE